MPSTPPVTVLLDRDFAEATLKVLAVTRDEVNSSMNPAIAPVVDKTLELLENAIKLGLR